MSQIIDNLLNVNIKHASTPVPVPPTGGGTEILSPDTGFGDTVSNVIGHLGGLGCGLIIVTLLLICSATIFFCLRRTFATNTGKAAALLTSLGLFAFAFGLSVPSAVMTTGAISETIQSTSSTTSAKQDSIVQTDIDVNVTDEGSIVTADTKIALESTAKYGFRVFAYMDEDNTLYNRDQTASIAATPTTPSADPTTLALNSYGVKDLNNNVYVPVSTDITNPTPIFETDQAAAAGSTITLNYAVKADSTVPEDTYSPLGQSIHYMIDFATKPTITYDGNAEGVTDVPKPTVAEKAGYGKQTLILSDQVPHKDGCTFYGWSINPSGSTILYQPGTSLELDGDITLYAIWSEPVMTAKAILGENGNLNFIYDEHEYKEGQTYTDNLGETVIKNVYPVPEDAYSAGVPWAGNAYSDYRADIISANITDQFYNFRAINTIGWFWCDGYISSITGLNHLNTSNITNTSSMFFATGRNVATFSLDVSDWDTSNVTGMHNMFGEAGYSATTWSIGDLSNWNTGNVTGMSSMFEAAGYSATTWSVGDLSNWNTSNVTDMRAMFRQAGYSATTWSIGDLSNWNTGNVTNMSYMFDSAGYNSTTWDIGDLSNWKTGNVTDMSWMFNYTGRRAVIWDIGNISNWDTGNVTDMSEMFEAAGTSASTFTLDLSGWDTNKVTDMALMFNQAGTSASTFTLDLSGWDTSNVTNTRAMFAWAGLSATTWSVVGLSDWDTGNVTDMSEMFDSAGQHATTFILDLSHWNTGSVIHMDQMFAGAGYNSTTWDIGDLSNWKTGNVTDMSHMFNSAGLSATTWSIGTLSNWDTSKVTNMSDMFLATGVNATTWFIGDLSNWDTGNVTDMSHMFDSAGYYSTTWDIGDLSNWKTGNVTDMSHMFSSAGYHATTWSVGDLSGWNTSQVTTTNNMFFGAGYNATNPVVLNLAGWNTGNVTNMSHMFFQVGYDATAPVTIYVGDEWDTDNVTDSTDMFAEARGLVGGAGTTFSYSNPTDKTYARVDNPPDAPGYFTYKGPSNPVTPTNNDNGGDTPIVRAPATRTQTADSVTVPNTNSDTDDGYSKPQGVSNNNPDTENNTPLIVTLIIASVALVGLIVILIYRLVRSKRQV